METSGFLLRDSLGYRLNRAAHGMALALAAQLRPVGLTPPQWAVLQDVSEHPGTSQRELSDRIGMDVATLTELAARLERRDLLVREQDPRDARRWLVRTTEAAEGILPQARAAAAEVNRRAGRGLPEGRTSDLADLLDRLWRNLS